MPILNTFLAGLAVSQLMFFGIFTQVRFGTQRLARVLVFFSICLSAFLLSTVPGPDSLPLLDLLLSALAILTPAALWLFTVWFFRDDDAIPRYGVILIPLYFSLRVSELMAEWLGVEAGPWLYYLGVLLPTLIMLALSLDAMYMGAAGRSGDLLEERRQLRLPFVYSMGAVIIVVLLLGTLSPLLEGVVTTVGGPSLIDLSTPVILSALFLWTLALNFVTFRWGREPQRLLLEGPDQPDPQANADAKPAAVADPLTERIVAAMEADKLYTETGFTLTRFSETLAIPERKLRRTINETLGFRNFNQFLNHYRIEAASDLLDRSEEPVASIAMTVGFNSLSAFNKAFKDHEGITPREYRNRCH